MRSKATIKKLTADDFKLLKTLCSIYGPSGDETEVRDFIIKYITTHQKHWRCKPKLFYGRGFQNTLVVVFGKPRTAVFCHMDTVGFTHRYNKQLINIGSPQGSKNTIVWGKENNHILKGPLQIHSQTKKISLQSNILPQTGTAFVFESKFTKTSKNIESAYLDNRLGVFIALKLAETLSDGILAFTTWEEVGGGSVSFLQNHIAKTYSISQALIADVSWISEGVKAGKGAVISMRDRWIPRQEFVRQLILNAENAHIPFQREVEASGGSDAAELQMAENTWDWCFIGAPISGVHTPKEVVHVNDIQSMLDLYHLFLKQL